MCNTTNIDTNLSKSKIQTARNKDGRTQATRSGPETMLKDTAPVQPLALQPQPSQSKRMWLWRGEQKEKNGAPLLLILLLQDLSLHHISALGLITPT